jgi:hypothetical protein
MAFMFHPLDRFQDLLDLVCLGFALGILNVDPRIALPRGLVASVARALLPGSAEVVITHATEVGKTDAHRIPSHPFNQVTNLRHMDIVSLLILSSNPMFIRAILENQNLK